MAYILVGLLLCGIASALIAAPKGAAVGGFILGTLLGPLGVAVSFTLDNRTKCVSCGVRTDAEFPRCPNCGCRREK